MNEQQDLFAKAETAKSKAIQRVETNNREFVMAAFGIIECLARQKPTITALDVWAKYHGPGPRHPRAMGPAFMRANNAGLIAATNSWIKSGRTSDHNQQIRVWVSKIYATQGER